VEKFTVCGEWNQGIARIKCTNSDCKHEYFRPFSCKQWYLCPSCHQKRLLLLSEHLSQEVLLRLPHRQFVFTVPKLLRPYFKHNRKLFADVSKLIHKIITDYYNECTGKKIITGSIISYQSYGDMMRHNPHWHCIIMEGGLTDNNDFYHIPVKDSESLTETFRKAVINLFVKKELLNKEFAEQVLSWKHSGFSVDNSIFLFPHDDNARESLCQYIVRHLEDRMSEMQILTRCQKICQCLYKRLPMSQQRKKFSITQNIMSIGVKMSSFLKPLIL
jgi:hypothetical protein